MTLLIHIRTTIYGTISAMPQLTQEQAPNPNVQSMAGVHLFYSDVSLCSRKVLLVLALKKIPFVAHKVDIGKGENRTPDFLRINPRGLVPVLVHDGKVIVESNDICLHLDRAFPSSPILAPDNQLQELKRLLDEDDGLHMAVRTLTFHWIPSVALRQMVQKTYNKLVEEDEAGQMDVAEAVGQNRKMQRSRLVQARC